MKKIIKNKKFKAAALISFLTTTFLIGIFFSKVIFTPTDVAEAIIDGRELPESAYPSMLIIISVLTTKQHYIIDIIGGIVLVIPFIFTMRKDLIK